MNEVALTEQIDPLNFAVVRLQLLFDDTELGFATGFFYRGILDNKPNYWLVTNWHVLRVETLTIRNRFCIAKERCLIVRAYR